MRIQSQSQQAHAKCSKTGASEKMHSCLRAQSHTEQCTDLNLNELEAQARQAIPTETRKDKLKAERAHTHTLRASLSPSVRLLNFMYCTYTSVRSWISSHASTRSYTLLALARSLRVSS